MSSFRELMKDFRTKAGLSKADLARYLSKTHAYIRKIENDGYMPPSFENCQKLAEIFNLGDEDKQRFFDQAFYERTSKNQCFQIETNATSLKWRSDADFLSCCVYWVYWETKFKAALLSSDVQTLLKHWIEKALSEFDYPLLDLSFSTCSLTMQLEVPPTIQIQDVIVGLKNLSSAHVRNQVQGLSSYPSLWSKKHALITLGTPPTLAELQKLTIAEIPSSKTLHQ